MELGNKKAQQPHTVYSGAAQHQLVLLASAAGRKLRNRGLHHYESYTVHRRRSASLRALSASKMFEAGVNSGPFFFAVVVRQKLLSVRAFRHPRRRARAVG